MLKSINDAEPTMTRAERKVAAYIQADPERVLRQAIATVAAEAGVSEPTVIRFCRRLGCKGFHDFKLLLAQDLATGGHAGNQPPCAGDPAPELIRKVIGGALGALAGVRDSLDPATLGQAVDSLAAATRIEFYGAGGSGLLAREAQHRFAGLGVPSLAHTDPGTQIIAAAMPHPGSAIVSVSTGGETRTTLESAAMARSTGATLVAVAPRASPLAELADICLDVGNEGARDGYAAIQLRTAQLAVLDLLAVGVALARNPLAAEPIGHAPSADD